MLNEIQNSAKTRMEKSISALQHEFSRLRTGRAHPSLVEHIKVEYYGTNMQLNQVATIHASDPRTIAVSPWEKAMIPVIEKAIMDSDLGLNPVTAGEVVRIPIPPLTEERRKELVKVVRSEAEQARIAIRNIRRDANSQFKELLKKKLITEDEQKRSEDRVQDLTREYVKKVDTLLARKEDDLLDV